MTFGKPRLCIVTPHQHGGGAEYQIACLIGELVRLNRHEIFYLARHINVGHAPSPYEVVKIGRGNQMPRFGYIMDAIPLYRALRRIAPHAIYQRVGCGYTAICARYARQYNAQLIWHVAHDTDVSHRNLASGRNWLRSILEKRSIEYGIRNADQIVVQTRRQYELLQDNYGRKADIIISNFHPQPQETIDKSGALTVVWIGNFKRFKQPEVFARLARQLSDLKGVRFVMVGAPAAASGDRAWSQPLMASIQAAPNIEYLGPRSQHDVNELLARAHVYVNTSVHEGFSNTFIQAWMREVAVVSLHVNPDGVLDREGVGICAGSEEQLTHAVRQLLADSALRTDYAARGRRYVMQAHSTQNAQKLVEMIDAAATHRQAT